MEANFQSDFLKAQSSFQKPKSGKWKMDLSWNRIRFDFEKLVKDNHYPFHF